jgi:hypothetical protein
MPGGSELSADLEAAVARGPLRAWADRAAQELTLDAQREAPPARVWKTVGDERVRATHEKADGQAIPGNLKFILDKPQAGPTVHGQAAHGVHQAEGHQGGQSGNIARKASALGIELARYPRDETLSPGNRYRCRCSSPTITGMVAASVHPDAVVISGTQARFTVSTSFNRAAESEFGDGDSPGLRWMGRALNGFAARIASRGK